MIYVFTLVRWLCSLLVVTKFSSSAVNIRHLTYFDVCISCLPFAHCTLLPYSLAKEEELVAARNKAEELEKENVEITTKLAKREQELDLRTQEKVRHFCKV